MAGNGVRRASSWVERGFLLAGLVGLSWLGFVWLEASALQSRARRAVQQDTADEGDARPRGTSHQGISRLLPAEGPAASRPASAPDALEWGAVIGQLIIPRLGLSAPILHGDDDGTLRVAVGHLPDTPLPWLEGNTALAGHRDTLFRPLEHVRAGDEVQVLTPHGTFTYRVLRTLTVDPDDVWVLARVGRRAA
jgi:sortase A